MVKHSVNCSSRVGNPPYVNSFFAQCMYATAISCAITPPLLQAFKYVPHYKTTWGSKTFKDQVLDTETWVYKRLKSAGAVLVAKLVTRSLAYDVASMTLPATHCGVAALCATFGFVGRTCVMSLLESLRHPLEDPLSVDITKLTVGYVDDVEMEVVHVLESKPFKLNYIVDSVQCIVNFTMDQRSRKYDDYESQADGTEGTRKTDSGSEIERVRIGNLVGMLVIVILARFTNISGPPRSDCLRRTAMTTNIYTPPHCDHIGLPAYVFEGKDPHALCTPLDRYYDFSVGYRHNVTYSVAEVAAAAEGHHWKSTGAAVINCLLPPQ
ncbi:glutamyl-tRNA(Gln) amidotransferase subunit A [Pyrus ussuriensis x Pyrus communis]|uniref:Glutamyl-tRNA(Gln) amidotransferase subunit A n=1 Tax=Pyrus ussuriensis x Pyrus communis TaxID=2448454 RepID=A0A5N5HYP4_9ROSA|nr:glutamyl-tRNA(Gln) amidotransferase subunit A [Pyrus ussuriensis x Pyrus communis]